MNYYYPFRNYFEPLMDQPCPKTDALIMSGFRQRSGGYIDYAKKCGIDADYKNAAPNQGWHFIRSYLDRTDPEKARIDRVSCGEMIYWLAEVSKALSDEELDELARDVSKLDRRSANSLIKAKCFPKVLKIVMDEYSAHHDL